MACPTCGHTKIYRKTDTVFEVKFGSGRIMMANGVDRFLRCTLDVCGGCGRTTHFIQNPQEWLSRVGYDAVFDTGTPD